MEVRTPPKTPIPIISGTGKATNFKFGQNNNRVHRNKSPWTILEKRKRGRTQGPPNCFGFSGTGKATDFKFSQHIQRVHLNKSPLKILEKRERGRIQGLPNFLGTPYYLRNGKSYSFQIWPVHSEGPSEQKSIKHFRAKGAWAYPGTAQYFQLPPIISGTGKAMKFKFCKHIYRLNRNKCPLKISGKIAVVVVRDSRQFSGHPYV